MYLHLELNSRLKVNSELELNSDSKMYSHLELNYQIDLKTTVTNNTIQHLYDQQSRFIVKANMSAYPEGEELVRILIFNPNSLKIRRNRHLNSWSASAPPESVRLQRGTSPRRLKIRGYDATPPERKISPSGMIALELYKGACFGWLPLSEILNLRLPSTIELNLHLEWDSNLE